jgi:hypothetical protein
MSDPVKPSPKSPQIRDADPREPMVTVTDPHELEKARVASTYSTPPPPATVPMMKAADPSMLAAIPRIALPREQVAALALGDRAAFLLALVDGTLSIESILDASGMTPEEAIAVLRDLRRRGVIAFSSES